MSSIAKYLVQKGHNVRGYDQRKSFLTNQLEQDGIKVEFEKDKLNYSEATLYIYSSAINLEDKYLNIYKNKDNVISRPEFLTELSRESKIIGITGTHGKTSTTALLAHIFITTISMFLTYLVVLLHIVELEAILEDLTNL